VGQRDAGLVGPDHSGHLQASEESPQQDIEVAPCLLPCAFVSAPQNPKPVEAVAPCID
jgi:hypothetical protein